MYTYRSDFWDDTDFFTDWMNPCHPNKPKAILQRTGSVKSVKSVPKKIRIIRA